MKNIILQHYTGIPGELEKLSFVNISKYAKRIGVEYKFLEGNIFRNHLAPPCQKMIMLDKMWDEYDMVVMMDTDMFTVNGLEKNVFTDIEGTGLHEEFQTKLFNENFCKHFSKYCNKNYAYWGGCLWRLTKELRIQLRKHLNEEELKVFSGNFNDEGIMHALATKAKIKQDSIPGTWSYGSYYPNPEKAHIIHIRTKVSPIGPKRPKIENYLDLKRRGIIE